MMYLNELQIQITKTIKFSFLLTIRKYWKH